MCIVTFCFKKIWYQWYWWRKISTKILSRKKGLVVKSGFAKVFDVLGNDGKEVIGTMSGILWQQRTNFHKGAWRKNSNHCSFVKGIQEADNAEFVMSNLSLQWRHNGSNGVSNHQPHDCLLNRLFRRRSKKTSKLHVTGLCAGNSPGTSEFPTQMASYAENVSIWWRHHVASQNNLLNTQWVVGVMRCHDVQVMSL